MLGMDTMRRDGKPIGHTDSVADRSDRSRATFGVVAFLVAGAATEFMSSYVGLFFESALPLDDLASFVAVFLLSCGAVLAVAALGQWGRSAYLVISSAIVLNVCQLLSIATHFDSLHALLPTPAMVDIHEGLVNLTYSVGIVLLLAGFILAAQEARAAHDETSKQNEELRRQIVERQRAEAQWRDGEQRYRSLVEHTPLAVARFASGGQCSFANRTFHSLFDFAAPAAEGRATLTATLADESLVEFNEAWDAAARGESPRLVRTQHENHDGEPRWLGWTIYPWRDAQDVVLGVELAGSDITAVVEAGELVRQQELTARTVLDATSDIAFLMTGDGAVLYCNERAAQSLGVHRDRIMHRDVYHFVPRPIAAVARAKVAEALDHGNPVCFEGQWDNRVFEYAVYPVDANGTGNIAVFAREVTAQRHAEAERTRLVTALESVADSVIITDSHGIIQYVNPAFEEVTGYSRDEVLGKTPRLLRSGEHDQAFYDELHHTIDTGEVWRGRFVNRRKDGGRIEETATIAPVRGPAGDIVNFVALKRDVTHEMELERTLRRTQKMDALGTLASGIAHDFNNILSLMMGHAELLCGIIAEQSVGRSSLEQILRAGHRAAALIEQIQMFTRQQEHTAKPFPIFPLVQEAIDLLHGSLPGRIRLETALDENCGMVLADPDQIHQVVINLCTNAFHALGEHGGVLRIELRSVHLDERAPMVAGKVTPGMYVELLVADTGEGIAPSTLDRVFEPFYTTKPVGEGTGLGLSTVHGIVTGCRGCIAVESTLNEGTAFRVYLPRTAGSERAGVHSEEVITGGTESVLFVDDDAEICDLAVVMLQSLGYRVVAYTNPEEAVEHAARVPEQFDVVVTDYAMPRLTGVDLAVQVMDIRADLPVILLTGFAKGVDPVEARMAGVSDYLRKPISRSALARSIRCVLDRA